MRTYLCVASFSTLVCSVSAADLLVPVRCEEAKTEVLEISIPFRMGPPCVQVFSKSEAVCFPAELKVTNAQISRIEVLENTNAQGPYATISGISTYCFSAELQTRTRDHLGNYPDYRCTPARLKAVLHICGFLE